MRLALSKVHWPFEASWAAMMRLPVSTCAFFEKPPDEGSRDCGSMVVTSFASEVRKEMEHPCRTIDWKICNEPSVERFDDGVVGPELAGYAEMIETTMNIWPLVGHRLKSLIWACQLGHKEPFGNENVVPGK